MGTNKLTKETILERATKDNATVIQIPEKLHSEASILFHCGCGKQNISKQFRSCLNLGMYCLSCSRKNNKDKQVVEKTQKEPIYTLENFRKIAQNDNAIIIEEQDALKDLKIVEDKPTYIQKETKLKFLCKCGKEHTKSLKSIIQYGGAKCDKCSRSQANEKTKVKNLEEHGVEYSFQRPDVKEKIKKTIKTIYNVDNVSQSEQIKEKKKETTKLNYGVENPFQSETIKKQIKDDLLEQYKVDNVSKIPEIKQKISLASKISANNQETIEKRQETFRDKYGCDFYVQTAEFKEKSEQTNLENCGFTHWMKSPENRKKN